MAVGLRECGLNIMIEEELRHAARSVVNASVDRGCAVDGLPQSRRGCWLQTCGLKIMIEERIREMGFGGDCFWRIVGHVLACVALHST